MKHIRLSLALLGLLACTLVLAPDLFAQEVPDRVARGSLRPYGHVFAAYAVGWILVFGWVVSVGRRLARLEQQIATVGE